MMHLPTNLFVFLWILPFCLAGEESVRVEEELISQFEEQGEISTLEQLKAKIGPIKEPPRLHHYNYSHLTSHIFHLNTKFPNLTHVYSIGQSVEGRQLWVLVVSKHAAKHHKLIPEFKYVGNMHGNEAVGRSLLVALAWSLLHSYNSNLWIRRLVDTTRIHMLFSMNPDGYEESREGDHSSVIGRYNANGKDLNRNFPSRFPNYFPSGELQPETIAVMNWSRQVSFVLSANLHGGTTLVNYPFDDYPTRGRDSRYSPTPDNELFVRLAYSYARAHTRMWKKGPRCINDDLNMVIDPQHGIINGADWYIVPGGMQDWNYLATNCFEITIEINCYKYPYEKDLPFLWNENKYALLHFIDQTHNAVHGFVVDSETGEGIPNATVSIDNKAKIIVTDAHGEYWRLINQGEYELTVDANHYQPVTKRIHVHSTNRSPHVDVGIFIHPQSGSMYC
ncbi:hypothetical protein WR25_14756 [Diploscapter pachys]|uniref:Peptidase M14 domain-containing protein n=1 Tax=Diploscapter pachys TaxID=2018661 RepID=A0A2A2LBQ4_9BILA|nr:hypothetical protein WR25_14756 [Diploscapter pachys]